MTPTPILHRELTREEVYEIGKKLVEDFPSGPEGYFPQHGQNPAVVLEGLNDMNWQKGTPVGLVITAAVAIGFEMARESMKEEA